MKRGQDQAWREVRALEPLLQGDSEENGKEEKNKIESLEQFVWAAPGLPPFYRCLDGRPGEKRCL